MCQPMLVIPAANNPQLESKVSEAWDSPPVLPSGCVQGERPEYGLAAH